MNRVDHVNAGILVRSSIFLAGAIAMMAIETLANPNALGGTTSSKKGIMVLGSFSSTEKEEMSNDDIHGKRIVLRDSNGKDRAVLGLVGPDESPSLQFFANDGSEMLNIVGDNKGAKLSIFDPKNKVRSIIDGAAIRIVDDKNLSLVRLAFERSGGAESSSVSVQSSDGAPFISIGSLRQGPSSFNMAGAGGKGNITLTIENGIPLIHLRDEEGKTILKAPD